MYALSEFSLGMVYSQIVEGAGPRSMRTKSGKAQKGVRSIPRVSLSTMAKNIGFLIKNVPFASKKAEKHFNRAIELAKEIGMKGTMGMAYLDLGLLHKTKKRTEQARRCISEAIQLFEQCEAEFYLKQAREALASLEGKK